METFFWCKTLRCKIYWHCAFPFDGQGHYEVQEHIVQQELDETDIL